MAGRLQARKRHARKLGLEQLEGRQLLAGIVTITLTGTEFRFDGDANSNGMVLTYRINQGSLNEYRVSSTNTGTPNDPGTMFRFGATTASTITFNGGAFPLIPNTHILTVKLADNDDKFVYSQSAPITNVAINFLDANIDMGFGGKDTVETTFLRLTRDWKIWGGQPGTPPQIQAPVISLGRGGFNNVGRDFCYYGGNGNDDITMLATVVDRNVREPPLPANYLNPCLATGMNLRDGNDKFTISNAPTGAVRVGATNPASTFLLDTGTGNDAISVTGMTVGQMGWNLEDGNDTMFFQSTNIVRNSTIDGGPGYDVHTESNTSPKNNFKDANGNFILDNTPTNPVTPPFTAPPRQGTTTNPNGAELRYVNFENGQSRPPIGPGSPPQNGGNNGGGRWSYRREGSVVVSTSNSPNLTALQNLLAFSAVSGQYPQASASLVDGKLLVTGTDKSDIIILSDAGNGQIRVRVGSRILGTFSTNTGIAVNSLGGNDYIYVAPAITTAAMVSATASQDFVMGSLSLLLLDNSRIYANQQASEHPQFLLDPNSAASQDMALLEILGLPQESTDSTSIYANWRPR